MNDHNAKQQLRYLEEVCACLHRAGFETQPLENSQIPVQWNGTPLCHITGKGSVFYRREDVSTPQAEEALIRAEDIAARTLEYMNAMETAPQLKASGLEGDYRICIKRGESGYYPSDWSTGDAHENRRIADEQNRKRGVTPAQEEAMKIGSICGWDVPGADPDNCEDIVQRRGGMELG